MVQRKSLGFSIGGKNNMELILFYILIAQGFQTLAQFLMVEAMANKFRRENECNAKKY